MRNHLRVWVLAGLTVLALAASDCRWVKMKLGIGTTISDPAEGEPEWVIQKALQAALVADEAKGWKKFSKLLHTGQRNPASLRGWRDMKFRDFRKRVKNYIKDPEGPEFEVMAWVWEGERDDTLTIFVDSSKTDMPTPCTVKIDDDRKGYWKVHRCSL